MPTDIEIARVATLQPIATIAEKAGIPSEALNPYGKYIAKIDTHAIPGFEAKPDGKLILVTAISPTPAGEGKTTTTVGLGDGLSRIGKRAMIALREPSLGPSFGMKGGAAGGGYAQVVPMEQINLHFTGDFHAITSAHNLLAAMIDNHVYWGNALGLDTRHIAWRRVLDMNDRALRSIVSSLGGASNGFPREDGFDITVASEIMATGAMSVLLKDALMPNLVQTLEGTPAFVHGGPFANIAHGCNSVIATKAALKLADYVVTEAGFGADLGAEKFFDIKCRKAGLKPAAAVVVATVRALKMHGGLAKDALGREDLKALEAGLSNLTRHVSNLRKFGVPPIVAINHFTTDTAAEHELIRNYCRNHLGVEAVICRHWAEGGAGAEELARKVAGLADEGEADFAPLYPDAMPLRQKLETIAHEIYGAGGVTVGARLQARFTELEEAGFGNLPVCVAKTQYSFSADPTLRGAPSGHTVPLRELRLSAGAGFVVAICGDIMTMPGLPREPAAERIHIDTHGRVEGLF